METPVSFVQRVLARTGLHLSEIPDGDPGRSESYPGAGDGCLGDWAGSIVARRGPTAVVLVDPIGEDEDGNTLYSRTEDLPAPS